MQRLSVLGVAGALSFGFATTAGSASAEPFIGPTPPPATDASASTTLFAARPSLPPRVVSPFGVLRAKVRPLKSYRGSIEDVPAHALAAYQRAAAVIDDAAECHLDWPVLAAIGEVESNHGRVKKAPAENGKRGRGVVDDTDAGRLDHNKRYDAPVGPLGIMPADWAQAAVDADGDGRRHPRDVDDAALASAVLLCASGADLGDTSALRHQLRVYHHAPGYARTVFALVGRYDDDLAAAAVSLPPGGLVIPEMPPLCSCDGSASAPGHSPAQHPQTWSSVGGSAYGSGQTWSAAAEAPGSSTAPPQPSVDAPPPPPTTVPVVTPSPTPSPTVTPTPSPTPLPTEPPADVPPVCVVTDPTAVLEPGQVAQADTTDDPVLAELPLCEEMPDSAG